jgi:hypothetical protein
MAFVEAAKSSLSHRRRRPSASVPAIRHINAGSANYSTLVLAVILFVLGALYWLNLLYKLLEWADAHRLGTFASILALGKLFWDCFKSIREVNLVSTIHAVKNQIRHLEDIVISNHAEYQSNFDSLNAVVVANHAEQKANLHSLSARLDAIGQNAATIQNRVTAVEAPNETETRAAEGSVNAEAEVARSCNEIVSLQHNEAYYQAMESYDPAVLTDFLRWNSDSFEAQHVQVRLRHLPSLLTPRPLLKREWCPGSNRFGSTCDFRRHRRFALYIEETYLGEEPALVVHRSREHDRALFINFMSIVLFFFGAATLLGLTCIALAYPD